MRLASRSAAGLACVQPGPPHICKTRAQNTPVSRFQETAQHAGSFLSCSCSGEEVGSRTASCFCAVVGCFKLGVWLKRQFDTSKTAKCVIRGVVRAPRAVAELVPVHDKPCCDSCTKCDVTNQDSRCKTPGGFERFAATSCIRIHPTVSP